MTDGAMTKALKEPEQIGAKSEGQNEIVEDADEDSKETVNLDAIKQDIESSKHGSQQTVLKEVKKPFEEAVDSTNPISPVKNSPEKMKKLVYPPDFT